MSLQEDIQLVKHLRTQGGQVASEIQAVEGRLRGAMERGESTGDEILDFMISWGYGPNIEADLRKLVEEGRTKTGQFVLKYYEHTRMGEVTGDLVPPVDDVRSVIELARLEPGEVKIDRANKASWPDWKLTLPVGAVATALHGFQAPGWIRLAEPSELIVKREEGLFHRYENARRGSFQEHFGWMTIFHPEDTKHCDLYVGDEAVAAFIEKRWRPETHQPNTATICCLYRLAAFIADPLDRTPTLARIRDAARAVELNGLDQAIAIFRRTRGEPYDVRSLEQRLVWIDRLGLGDHPSAQVAKKLLEEKAKTP